MSDINISESELTHMLEKAYEEGYFGYLETKKDYIKLLVSNLVNSKPNIKLVCSYDGPVSFSDNITYGQTIITNSV